MGSNNLIKAIQEARSRLKIDVTVTPSDAKSGGTTLSISRKGQASLLIKIQDFSVARSDVSTFR